MRSLMEVSKILKSAKRIVTKNLKIDKQSRPKP